MKHTIFVTSAYFRPTSASGNDAGSLCKNGGSEQHSLSILAEVRNQVTAKTLLFKQFLAEVGGSAAEVNPRTPYTLLPPTRISNVFRGVRYNGLTKEWKQRDAS